MVKAIFQAARNLHLKDKNSEIVANNLANINSPGYKRSLPFSELMTRFENEPIKHMTDFTDGNLIATNNKFDLAVTGGGFFVVETKDGNELTRNGSFTLSDEGFLVDKHGNKVLGQKGPLFLAELLNDKNKQFTVNSIGEIRVGDKVMDKLFIGKISEQQSVTRSDGQRFSIGGEAPDYAEDEDFKVTQGFVEEANVSPILEMQFLINLNKDFEATHKIIGFFDGSLNKANEVGRT